ncbi:DUF6683 family protein [Duganella sp. HH101]|uniref:DUF6683 family protein n=1 Tax=Duganella sp. HH101 TaxID=1781066 RepID=UPI0008756D15|nr:DUF6683 family protein [Duganella sp. HH101]OEZ97476.1 hypothetical protein DUGA2_59980 [Duganella sp. HH101]
MTTHDFIAARRLLAGVASAALLMAAWPAQAQWLGQDYASYGVPMSNFIQLATIHNLNMIDAATPGDKKSAAAPAPLRAEAPPAVQRNAQELAQRFPAAQRAPMAQAYQDSMEVYQKIEAKMGWSRNDVGGALAAFVVGNYMAMRDTEVADEDFAAVARQMRNHPRLAGSFRQQSAASLRNLYEQSAMVGTFMALAQKSLQQTPQPTQQANLRAAARENLKLVLGADPERLHIGARGAVLE